MNVLVIPVAPLSRTKSRLRDCFSKEQLKDLTIAMFKDLASKLLRVKFFEHKLVYCNTPEILELAKDFGLTGIKEELTQPRKSFDEVIDDINTIAMNNFDAERTIFTFLDVILISPKNFNEINSLMKKNQILVCPAINTAGISIFGRKPPNIVSSKCFSNPKKPSLISLFSEAEKKGFKMTVYDSFRAGFDIDLKQDLVLAYEYLKIFNLTRTETYKFLKDNLKLTLQKTSPENNRNFKFIKKI